MTTTAWAAVLIAMTVVPFAMSAWRGDSTSPGTMLSVGLAVLGLTALIVVVLVPSRIRTLTRAFGVDRVMGLHRWLGMLALTAVVLHAAVALWNHPTLINPFTARDTAKVGWGSLVALLLVGGVAAGGRRPGARYEVWARLHVALAAAGLVLAALHVIWLNHLVADPVMRVCLVVLAGVLFAVLSHRWVWRPLFSRQGAYVVYGVRREGPSVSTLVLAPVHLRRGGMRFDPGQFVWLRLKRAVVGTEEHPFTIASSANVTGRLELTVRDQGDFSHRVAALRQGEKVWLDGPHGSFTTQEDQDCAGLVLVAGGVGITPMMSMLRTLAERGDTRRHRLVLAERGSEPLFADELAVLERRLELEVIRTAGRRVDLALLSEVVPGPPERDHLDYFICGPPSLLAGALAALEQLAVPATRIHTEQFGWSGPMPTSPAASGTAAPGPSAPPSKDTHGQTLDPSAHPALGGRRSPLDPAGAGRGPGLGLDPHTGYWVGVEPRHGHIAGGVGPLPPGRVDHRAEAAGRAGLATAGPREHDAGLRGRDAGPARGADDDGPRRRAPRRGGRHASV
ncbi:MAG TPA: ferredoxin reductase family protein [Actinomycetospora sp.]|jgi:predicted ferric reductase|uniref:ferredoxin reductase family protein n=1 Tax=Actinomycetospora sp. TaxID=1872135 RepID=UPI002F413260